MGVVSGRGQESDLQSLMVLSFSRAPEAIMFSVGWQAVQMTTSVHVCVCNIRTLSTSHTHTHLNVLPVFAQSPLFASSTSTPGCPLTLKLSTTRACVCLHAYKCVLVPFLQSQRSLQRCSTSHSYVQHTSSNTARVCVCDLYVYSHMIFPISCLLSTKLPYAFCYKIPEQLS